jgi:DNA-binding XRE family transcriptional regulator
VADNHWHFLSKARKLHDLEKVMAKEEFLRLKSLLSANIKRLRNDQGIAQERLGLEAGVDRTLISKIEREIANPSLEVLTKIAVCLGVNVKDLFKEAKK